MSGRFAAAAVTGAASGIGRHLALRLAAQGCDLALADRNLPGLEQVAAEIADAHPVKVTVTCLDVSDPRAIEDFAAAAVAAHPRLNLLINNAGVALFGDFHEIGLTDFEWVMDINFWGVVRGCRAFLPHLTAQPAAHIVNLSSLFGLIAPPGQAAYAASKFAVRGFSEALRHECAERGGNVRVSVVHPGGIKTNIVRGARLAPAMSNLRPVVEARFAQVARTTPDQAAARIIEGALRGEPRILIGGDARLLDKVQRLFPATYMTWLRRMMRGKAARDRRV